MLDFTDRQTLGWVQVCDGRAMPDQHVIIQFITALRESGAYACRRLAELHQLGIIVRSAVRRRASLAAVLSK